MTERFPVGVKTPAGNVSRLARLTTVPANIESVDEELSVDLFEWQAKELFAKYGVPTTKQVVVTSVDDVRGAAEQLGGGPVMVKAQVKAGGRGKAGGVKYAPTADDAVEKAGPILGMDIKGHTVRTRC